MKIFVTRRWPEAVEDALRAHFEPTFNTDAPLDKAALIECFASHDIAALTVSTVSMPISSPLVLRGCRLIANYGVGVNHIDGCGRGAGNPGQQHARCADGCNRRFDPDADANALPPCR